MTTALTVMAAISMQAQETAYKITGTVPASVSKVYLYVMGQRAALDSATVSNGKFELSGKQNLNEIFMLDANNEGMAFFNDGTPVDMNLVNYTMAGSDLNKKLFECSLPLKSMTLQQARYMLNMRRWRETTAKPARQRLRLWLSASTW